eukprot:gnl/Carplike_NY0171/4109_a5558_321.p1 GENE.gnl/Carplike_NY0171/4109_a5558_321~~gnl/Carplike_NY0171/4109_a5558_321.p1  ORF type:complete len:138 (+),score=9.29 gnl/Carplike_NY0171/4109_a5558_321:57-470(+)
MKRVLDVVKPGVVTGDDVQKLFQVAKEEGFAIPAVNVVGTNSINAALEAAKEVNSPIIIQFSNGGASFFAGKGMKAEGQNAAIIGAIAGAKYVHAVAEHYGIQFQLSYRFYPCALNILHMFRCSPQEILLINLTCEN